MNSQPLIDIARALVGTGRGLLAIDESTATCDKRFAKLGIPQTVHARRAYRELIISTAGHGRRSYPRAMPRSDGAESHRGEAQQALLHRAHCNRAALRGEYTVEMERN
jgi:hypothetical protein